MAATSPFNTSSTYFRLCYING